MRFTILFFLTSIHFGLFSQEQHSLRIFIPNTGPDSSIVFTKEYTPPIDINGKLITPTKNDLIKSENLLFKREAERKKFRKYNRQYLAFVNQKGEQCIIIKMLNFKCRKKAIKMFPEWGNQYFVGFGEYYEKNTRRYIVNLFNGSISR